VIPGITWKGVFISKELVTFNSFGETPTHSESFELMLSTFLLKSISR
jgi:hypothetical protein